jgi:DNA-binding NtrC family response regulator|tara:strand:+ start:1843 stop:3201 length:1359 start_codon:yes stop_codon:yes gene_type:complete
MKSVKILVVDDELDIRELIQEILSDEGYIVTTAASADEARKARDKDNFDLILLDIWMPETDGITLLKEWSENDQLNSAVVMMSGHGNVDTAIESTHLGASNFVEKPLSIAKLLRTIEDALTERKPKGSYAKVGNAASFISIGHSEHLKKFRKELRHAASLDSNLMLIGEAGTARAAFARYIHDISQRAINPCIELASALITSTNTEEQILGKEVDDQIIPGFIEQAKEGTLVVNGLSDLSMRAQQLLHNILENGQYNRINGNSSLQIKCRVIAIVDEDYIRDMQDGKLKRELISNISIQTLRVAALRDHAEDVPDFIKFYVDYFVEIEQLTFRRFSIGAQNRLRNYPWPDNLRELKNIIRRLLIEGRDDDVTLDEIEGQLKNQDVSINSFVKQDLLSLPLREAREKFERAYLQEQLILCDGKVGQLAKRVGVERTHLYRKLKALEISIEIKA